jgi:hypothetical protein
MNRNTLILGALLGIVLAIGYSPYAFASWWTHTASAGMIDDADLSDFAASNEEVYFKSGKSGSIYLRCNITNPNDDGTNPYWDYLGVTYKDPDGTGTATRVVVYVKRVSKTTGSTSTLATFDSNTVNVPSTNYSWICFDTEVGDFSLYYYFLEAMLYRPTNSTKDVRVYGFDLATCIEAAGTVYDENQTFEAEEYEGLEE